MASVYNRIKKTLWELHRYYETTVGLREMRLAHKAVVEAETCFHEAMGKRQALDNVLRVLQAELDQVSGDRLRASRSHGRFLDYMMREHRLLVDERRLQNELGTCTKNESQSLYSLAECMRRSHEQERFYNIRNDRSLWIGSLCCAGLSFTCTMILSGLKSDRIRRTLDQACTSHLPVDRPLAWRTTTAAMMDEPTEYVLVHSNDDYGQFKTRRRRLTVMLSACVCLLSIIVLNCCR